MSTIEPSSATFGLVQEIESAEKAAGERHKALGKLKARLKKAGRELSSKPKPLALLAKLIADLKAEPSASELIERLERQGEVLRERVGQGFVQELRDRCEAEGIEFRAIDDSWGVGAFELRTEFEKEVASLRYARLEIEKNLPLDAGQIVSRVKEWTSALLEPPKDLAALAGEIREALRVSLARQGHSLVAPELRVDLPSLYREMIYVRQGRSKPASKAGFKDYSPARFTVELKTLLQSDENCAGRPPLET